MKKPGLRNIKTAISVLIVAITIEMLNFLFGTSFTYFYGAITAVFTLQQTNVQSKIKAKSRILGTIIGGIVGIVIGVLRINILNLNLNLILLFIGIIACIWLIDNLNIEGGVMIACIMLIGSFNDTSNVLYIHTLIRGVETIYGSYIAIVVNKYLFPYTQK